MNKVDYLLEHPFVTLSETDKSKVQKLGPDHPCIFIIQQHKTQSRYFNTNWYYKKSWLTASENKKTLFCFYCLIFDGDVAWTHHGIKDLKHLSERIKTHEQTARHIENTLKFKYFDENNTVRVREENEARANNAIRDNAFEYSMGGNGDIPSTNQLTDISQITSIKQEIVEIPDISNETCVKNEIIEFDNSGYEEFDNFQKKRKIEETDGQPTAVQKENLDAVDLLFLSYARTLKTFPKKKQIVLKARISQLLMDAEMEEIE